jgi:tRNA (guanosine-2'-O-)-methyltransferase
MFPFTEKISLSPHLQIDYRLVLEKIAPMLTEARCKKIDQVVQHRHFSTAVVLEGIYDRGNTSAVIRTAEGFGFAQFHIIETSEAFKESQRVTKGAEKWVEARKWKKSADCISHLKSQGYRLLVTALSEKSKPLSEVSLEGPVALVLGNEKEGASAEMIAAADELVVIPMHGFVQSFNISVAAALSLYQISCGKKALHQFADLTETQKDILKAHYYLRTQDSAVDYLKELYSRQAWS